MTRCTRGCLARIVAGALLLAALPGRAQTTEHYELTLRPDYAARVLMGHARIRVEAQELRSAVVELASPKRPATSP